MANCIQCGRQLPGFSFKKICQWCVQHEAAQRGEEGAEPKQRVMPTPWVRREASISLTQILFGANVAVFLGMALASGTPLAFANPMQDFSGELIAHWGANFGPYTLSGSWWRLVTYMFLHGSLLHIAFNMWCLWDLGRLCESLYGRWTFLCVYLLTGIAAGLASVGWNPLVLSVGASGAIFGLAGALIASFALGEFSTPRAALQGTLKSLLFFVGFNVVLGGAIGGIDNAAHVGGLVSGLILGALIAKLAPDHDGSPRRIGVLLISLLMVLLAARLIMHWRGPMFSQANTAASARSVDRMVEAGEKKIQQHPEDASAHYALAHAYFVKKQFAQGENELKRVLELQPENAQARMLLASVYLEQEQSQDARDQFTRLIAQDPDNAKAHAGLGAALANLHEPAAAIAEYQAALKIDPEYGDAYYNMGASYANLKQYDDAITAFLNARAKSGDDPGLEEALAAVYEAKGMTVQANAAKNRAAQLRGDTN